MPVSFNSIPSNLRVPLFYAEMDNSAANSNTSLLRSLLIAQVNDDAAHDDVGKLVLVSRSEMAARIGGAGSVLHAMHLAYRAVDLFGEVWCLPVKVETGVAATGSITITGPATGSGVLCTYIAGTRVQLAVVNGDAAAAVATGLVAAINANAGLPVIATLGEGAVVSLAAKFKGVLGNDITLLLNKLGSAGGEVTPAGLGVTLKAMAEGAGAPDMAAALMAVGDEAFEFIGNAFTDVASLNDMRDWMGDDTGRWSWIKQLYGHSYSATRGELGQLNAMGTARNDQHVTAHGFETLVPTPSWVITGNWLARTSVFISADPARPTQTGLLPSVDAAPAGSRFTLDERQALLSCGVATAYCEGGYRIERAITTYQRNSFGANDDSYLDSETLHTSAYVLRYLRSVVTSKYARHKLANDGTRYGPGQAIVTPSVIRGELVAAYRHLEYLGIVENADAFAKHLIVERSSTNPNRVDVLFPPDYVNQLRVFAVCNQFRLQYAEEAA